MVKEKLIDLHSTVGIRADALKRDIQDLKVEKLHKMENSKTEAICHEVINSVEMNLLVSVEEGSLEARRLKKEKKLKKGKIEPLQYTEYETNKNGVKLRKHWASREGIRHILPRGWVYRDKGRKDKNGNYELLGVIYQTKEEKGYAAFIQREIADNPHGAYLLLKVMKDRLEKPLKKNI